MANPLRRPNRLRKIRLTELSLVDRGANQRAHVVITKRAPTVLLFGEAQRLIAQPPITSRPMPVCR